MTDFVGFVKRERLGEGENDEGNRVTPAINKTASAPRRFVLEGERF